MAGQSYRVKVTFELISKDQNKSGKVLVFTAAHLGFRKLSFLLGMEGMPYFQDQGGRGLAMSLRPA